MTAHADSTAPHTPSCPICGKPASAKDRPFCSNRCRDVDLGRWLKEGYRIESDDTPDEEIGETG
jgi:endogenous inhibitor of DNA gyrase (YacG/DUF329 family)